MSPFRHFVGGLVLGLLVALVVRVDAGTAYRYTGVELENLRDAFNANATLVNSVKSDLNDVIAKLNSDPGVGFTNFASTNSASTCDTLRR